MAAYTLRETFTLSDTNWANKTPADFKSMSAGAYVPQATDRILVVNIENVTTNDCSVCYGARTGSADAGARAVIGVPDPKALPDYSTFDFKNLTIDLHRDGEGDSGDKIDITGLSRSALRTKMTALITAAKTGVAGLTSADGPTDDLIVVQATAGEADVPSWSAGRTRGAWAQGLVDATAMTVTAGGTMPPIKTFENEETSILALRANTANSVVTVEIEVRPHGSPVVR